LFSKSKVGLVFITTFLDKKTLLKYLSKIAWETDIWVAENPTHLIHLNGKKFLGPYLK
jgi:adenine-specific DNA-methyltransferase